MEIHRMDEFLRYYRRLRGRTRAVAVLIPPERLEWTPVEGRFTPGDLLRHLAGTERWMFTENVCGRPSRYPGHGRELADGLGAVLAYLDRAHEETLAVLSALSPADLEAPAPTVGGIEMRAWKWLRAMAEHEVHHRGQLYTLLGLLGVGTPPLFGLTEPEVLAASEPG